MKIFLGLVVASLVASAYSYGCQQRHNNRHAQPLVDMAPKWSLHFPKFDSFWGQDLLDDPWHMFDHIIDDTFHIFKPNHQEAKPAERVQCKTSGVDIPLDDVPKSNVKAEGDSNIGSKYEDWSEDAELQRRQEWEKKLQDDVQKEQQRREEWYKEKMTKARQEQEQRERRLAQERQRQQDILKRQEEDLLRREEQMRKKRQEMEEKLRREKLEEKRKEEEMRIAEERQRRVREAHRIHEEARKREAERQEQLHREQWLQEKKQEEQRRQMEDFRRQEEQRAQERLRILEEKQRATQRELEEKIRLQREQVQQEQERQQEELRRKREQWAERGAKHFNTHSFHESSTSNSHNIRADGSEQVIFDMVLTGYYPADLSVRVRDGILQIEGSHVCSCKEDCFMREFERKATIPSGVDTQSLSATLDSDGNFKVTGVQHRHAVQQSDADIPVFGIHMPRQMPPALKYCPEGKTTYKLGKIDPATGNTHKRNAYKFERRKSHHEDDGVTIEVAEDYA